MEAILASGLRMDPAWAPSVSARVRAQARDPPVGATAGERSLLACIAGEATVLGEPIDAAVRHATAALADGRLLKDETCESAVFLFACTALTCAGRFALSRRHLGDALVDARARGLVLGFAFGSTFRAEAAFGAGDLRQAEADAGAALEPIDAVGLIVSATFAAGRRRRPAGRDGRCRAPAPRSPGSRATTCPGVHARRRMPARMQLLAVDVEQRSGRAGAGRRPPRIAVPDADPAPVAFRGGPRRGPRPSRRLDPRPRRSSDSPARRVRHGPSASRSAPSPSSGRRPAASSGCAPRWPRSRTPRRASTTLTRCATSAWRFVTPPPGATRVSRCVSRPTSPQSVARAARGTRASELLASGARPRRTRVFGRDALTPAEMRGGARGRRPQQP